MRCVTAEMRVSFYLPPLMGVQNSSIWSIDIKHESLNHKEIDARVELYSLDGRLWPSEALLADHSLTSDAD